MSGAKILHSANADTGELTVYSSHQDIMLFDEYVGFYLQEKIIEAIREAEKIAYSKAIIAAVNSVRGLSDK